MSSGSRPSHPAVEFIAGLVTLGTLLGLFVGVPIAWFGRWMEWWP